MTHPGTSDRVATAAPGRVRSLDGLRGIAAVLVVLNHVLITSPTFAEPYRGGEADGGLAWLLTYTPLHVLWGGTEAVLVFFVLSGYVLTLPVLHTDRAPWRSYYAQRLVRLYAPVWGALVLAMALAVLVPRTDVSGASWWLNGHQPVGERAVVASAALVSEPSFSLNSALWSLRWEVAFSVLLPLFVGVAVLLRRQALLSAAGLFLAVAVGCLLEVKALMYLPVFGLGVLMALHADQMTAGAARLRPAAWRGVVALALCCLTALWMLLGATGSLRTSLVLGLPLEVLGAALAVLLFAQWRPCTALGESAPAQWLGKHSFSLYLVHEPIVVAVGFLLHSRGGAPLVLVVAVPLALATTVAFHRWVERPTHLLARRAGQRLA